MNTWQTYRGILLINYGFSYKYIAKVMRLKKKDIVNLARREKIKVTNWRNGKNSMAKETVKRIVRKSDAA